MTSSRPVVGVLLQVVVQFAVAQLWIALASTEQLDAILFSLKIPEHVDRLTVAMEMADSGMRGVRASAMLIIYRGDRGRWPSCSRSAGSQVQPVYTLLRLRMGMVG